MSSIRDHRRYLEHEGVPLVNRHGEYYPYRSHLQPALAWVALSGCLFVLFVASSAPLWGQDEFYLDPFLSSYLVVRFYYSAPPC